MQIIGFNFTRISAERHPGYKGKIAISTNIEFPLIEKEKVEIIKDSETYKIDFKLSIVYSDTEQKEEKEKSKKDLQKMGEVIFQGNMILALQKEDPKEISKALKKSDMPLSMKEYFLNLVLKKCTTKALDLEDQIGLPLHMPLPQVKIQEKKD